MAQVTLRYWAAMRAAAGTTGEVVDATTLAEALDTVRAAHGADSRFAAVMDICAIVVDGTPAGKGDRTLVPVRDGSVVELLPPFAGGSSSRPAVAFQAFQPTCRGPIPDGALFGLLWTCCLSRAIKGLTSASIHECPPYKPHWP